MNDAQRIILWSGVILLGIFTLVFGPVPDALRSTTAERPQTHVSAVSGTTQSEPTPARSQGFLEVVDTCGPYFDGICLNARSGPGTEYPALMQLRAGAVLQYDGAIERDGTTWYHIIFDEWLRYPERAAAMYVASDYVRVFDHEGLVETTIGTRASTTKLIVIDRSEQMLYAYDDEEVYMSEKISTGIALTPTPRGTFYIYKKTPSRYMQGPIPGISEKVFDLPGVPWNLYFSAEGAVIHGAYWHDKFGQAWSNGCVNMPPEKARRLYEWADLGTPIVVRD